jgi:hypothetical protein
MLEMGLIQAIVRIDKDNKFSSGSIQAGIPCGTDPSILFMDGDDPVICL